MGSSGEYERGHLPSQRMRRRAIAQSVGERVEEAGAVARLPHLRTGRMTGRMTGGMTGGMTGRTTGRNDGPGGLLGRAARRACAHLCACALVRLCVRAVRAVRACGTPHVPSAGSRRDRCHRVAACLARAPRQGVYLAPCGTRGMQPSRAARRTCRTWAHGVAAALDTGMAAASNTHNRVVASTT